MESSVVRSHVPEEELHAYCDGELSPPQRVEIAEHLLGCLICRSQHAEVEEIRARTSRLLAVAAPRMIRPPVIPTMMPGRARRQVPRFAAVAAAAVISTGLWFSLQPDRADSSGAQFAATLIAPELLTRSHHQPAPGPVSEREIEVAAPAAALPGSPVSASQSPAAATRTTSETDPGTATAWPHSNWDDALTAANGSLARIPGVLVTAVRVRADAPGTRPTFMVRQELGNGHAVWVIDGPTDGFAPVLQALAADGLASSLTMRTRPDYATVNAQLNRPARTMVVVGQLPVDSLNILASKLKLR